MKKDSSYDSTSSEVHNMMVRLKHRARVVVAKWEFDRASRRRQRDTRRSRSDSEPELILSASDAADSESSWRPSDNDAQQHTQCKHRCAVPKRTTPLWRTLRKHTSRRTQNTRHKHRYTGARRTALVYCVLRKHASRRNVGVRTVKARDSEQSRYHRTLHHIVLAMRQRIAKDRTLRGTTCSNKSTHERWMCQRCKVVFDTRNELREYQSVMHGGRGRSARWACSQCLECFRTWDQLRTHRRDC